MEDCRASLVGQAQVDEDLRKLYAKKAVELPLLIRSAAANKKAIRVNSEFAVEPAVDSFLSGHSVCHCLIAVYWYNLGCTRTGVASSGPPPWHLDS